MRAVALLAALPSATALIVPWACAPLAGAPAPPLPAGITFAKLVCESLAAVPVFGKAGPINVSVLSADLSRPSLRLASLTDSSLATVDAMAAAAVPRKIWGGINAGYFWRLDVKTFFDGVCLGKSRADAEAAPAAAQPNYGVGDGVIVSGGALAASNCDCIGFSRPAVLTINGSASRIDVVHRGDPAPFGLAFDSTAAGPNLVSSNLSGSFIDIPSDDDNIGNILEHSANTAVGLFANGTALLVTTDGFDGCSGFDATCGVNAYTLAYLMKDHFGVAASMGMDQGGSTTMYVKGAGVVSNPGQGTRPVFSGLFIEEL